MKNIVSTILFLCFFISVANAEELKCKNKRNFDSGESELLEAKLTLENQDIKDVSITKCKSNGKEGGGYCCFFESKKMDYKKEGNVHTFLDTEFEKIINTIVTKRDKNGLILELNLSRDYCGFGAEFPKSVKIAEKSECIINP